MKNMMQRLSSVPMATRLRLFGASFLGLFTELVLIRYLPGHVPVLAYFTNIVLIGSFFGLGMGFVLCSPHRSWAGLYLPTLLFTVLVVQWFDHFAIVTNASNTHEMFWLDEGSGQRYKLPMAAVVLVAFVLTTASCIPVGQSMGRCFAELERLGAYHIDLLGSLLGIFIFAAFAAVHAPPVIWFALIGIIAVPLFYPRNKRFGAVMALTLLLAAGLFARDNEIWSSYYRINWRQHNASATVIKANQTVHQVMLDLDSPDTYNARSQENFAIPYQELAKRSPELDLSDPDNCVLIVGAGSGNDIAMARSQGARCIHAVEIDRAFAQLGRDGHPQRPYQGSEVRLIIDDARAYFSQARRVGQSYALIIFGTLDSMALTGGHSTRLDSYVYTRESFAAAYELLKQGGMIGIYHLSQKKYIAERIAFLLASIDNLAPLIWKLEKHTLFNFVFVKGKGVDLGIGEIVQADHDRIAELVLPSDDWPFLFLDGRIIPNHYLVVLAGVLLFVVVSVGLSVKARAAHFDGPLFFLGAGFMLLETKSVTQMSLLFGSTWVVNVLVFAAIMLVLLAANNWIRIHPQRQNTALRLGVVFSLLISSLVALSYIPLQWVIDQSELLQWIYAGLLVGIPIGLAGLIFPALFAQAEDTRGAFASNLLGVVLGGMLEYSVILFGISAMNHLAALLYLGALALWYRRLIKVRVDLNQATL